MNDLPQIGYPVETRDYGAAFIARRTELLGRISTDLGSNPRDGDHHISLKGYSVVFPSSTGNPDHNKALVTVSKGQVCEINFFYQDVTGETIKVCLIVPQKSDQLQPA